MEELDLALQSLHLWCLISDEEERRLLRQGSSLEILTSGDRIFSEGDSMGNLCYLCSGQVVMSRSGVNGRSHITRLVRSGQFFGIRPYFAGKSAQSTATVFGQEAALLRICTTVIGALLERNTRICRYFLEVLSTELERIEERMITLTQKHIRGRLADTLLLLAKHYGYEADGITLSIYLSRRDLGTLSNMTTSNVIRTLSLFASERIVSLEGRRIRIINSNELERISRIG